MKKVGILLITVISAICLCFGLAACGKGGNKKTPLAAPEDVAVVGDTLSWSAVEGATAGYTVKINSDETTKVTTGTTLDLTTVTGKLHEGSNTLSVKANATDAALESPYSAQKTYTYTPTPAQKQPLATPQNVKVEGDTLSWSAVEGATEGYTVKINDNESTKVTTGTTLDLTTVTALLQKGANTLSVKANATEDALESVYSATATYTYTPSVEQEAADYKSLVEAIGSITGNSTKADADAVKAAIDAAETKYNGLSDEAKALQDVVTAKVSFDAKKTAYEGTMSAAEALHTTFANAVTKATATITAAESLETLTSDKTAADAAHTALTTLAQGFVTDEERAAYDNIATKFNEWTKAVNDEKDALEGVQIPTLTDDASAEEIIEKVNAALEGYDALPEYVKNDNSVKTLHDDLVAKRSAAESQIKSTVDALVEEIETALQNKTEATKENYEVLTALLARVDAIAEGTYAAELFEESGKGEALAEAIEAMESKIVEVLKDEIVLYNNDNKTDGARIVVIRKYVNFKGEGMQLTTQPTVTATEQVSKKNEEGTLTEGAATVTQATVVWNEQNGTYVITIPFTRISPIFKQGEPDGTPEVKEDENAKVVIRYTLSGVEGVNESETTVTVGLNPNGNEGVCYDNEHVFFNKNTEALQVYWANNDSEKNLSVYDAEDIEGTGADFYPTDLPLFKVTANEISSLDDLKTQLAQRDYVGKTVNVRIIAWQKYEVNSITRYSAINGGSLSDQIEVQPTAEDLKPRLPQPLEGTVTRNDGSILLVLPGNWATSIAAGLGEEMTDEEVRALIDIRVTVTLGEKTESFTVPMPTTGDTAVSAPLMKKNIYTLFGDTAGTGEQTYTVSVQLLPKEGTEYTDRLRASYELNGSRQLTLAVSEEDAKLTFNPAVGETPWNLGSNPGEGNIQYRWEAVDVDCAGLHDGLLIHVYNVNDITDVQTHDFSAVTPFATFKATKRADIAWSDLLATIRTALIDYVAGLIKEEKQNEIVYAYTFVFAMQIVPTDEAAADGYLASDLIFATKSEQRETWQHTFEESDYKATNEAQLNYTKNDNGEFFEFLRSGKGNGYVFTEFGADHVEVKFTKDGTNYTAYLFVETVTTQGEDGVEKSEQRLRMYKNLQKEGTALDCDTVTNGYTTLDAFNNWVKTAYGLETFDVRGWTLQTHVIVNDESVWLVSGEWSQEVLCPAAAGEDA